VATANSIPAHADGSFGMRPERSAPFRQRASIFTLGAGALQPFSRRDARCRHSAALRLRPGRGPVPRYRPAGIPERGRRAQALEADAHTSRPRPRRRRRHRMPRPDTGAVPAGAVNYSFPPQCRTQYGRCGSASCRRRPPGLPIRRHFSGAGGDGGTVRRRPRKPQQPGHHRFTHPIPTGNPHLSDRSVGLHFKYSLS